jgi:enhancing lycopene biosynthesis protein 2
MVPKIGVLLSGCGVMDGSEIHEATLTLYFLDRHGAEAVCIAPDKDQADVIDHFEQIKAAGARNVLHESARIARGKVRDVRLVSADELDGIIIPGGYGAAKNLCTFAADGAGCRVDEGVERLLKWLHQAGKPVGALCIAPALVAAILGNGVELTIGSDPETAAALEQMGAIHRPAGTGEIVVDVANRVVSTPCYMTAAGIGEVGEGIEKAVLKVIELATQHSAVRQAGTRQ